MKILFLQRRLLFPANSGGKIRTLNILRWLAQWHEITYLCSLQAGEERFAREMEDLGVRLVMVPWAEAPRGSLSFYRDLALNVFSPYPFNVDKNYDPKMRRVLKDLLGEDQYDLLVCDFVQLARNVFGLQRPPSVLFQHNVEAQIFERHAAAHGSLFRRGYMWLQAQKMNWFERAAGKQFESVVAVSERDREMFSSRYGWSHVQSIDTAVDVEFFTPATAPPQPGRVVFIGSLDWLPNQDGVLHFVKQTWPLIRQQLPDAQFEIVGRNPSANLQKLHNVNGIRVAASVPDIRPHLHAAEVCVVPLLVGGGTRLKIFESLAAGTPVVSTSLGAEGLDVRCGEHLLLADTPTDFAAAVVKLCRDRVLRQQLSEQGRQLVESRFSAELISRQFEAICHETVRQSGPGKVRSARSKSLQVVSGGAR